MPKISLVVCLYKEGPLLDRLLRKATGYFDDLVVVHDGSFELAPSAVPQVTEAIDYAESRASDRSVSSYRESDGTTAHGSISSLVKMLGGKYYEAPRSYQQETHWPFAWAQAKHDWILRLDADEFPSGELLHWLQSFRASASAGLGVSGYTCIWPLWDGEHRVTNRWPRGRVFLFNRRRVRFFGMVEQNPVSDDSFEELDFILEHQPTRKSYGLCNVLARAQAYRWRRIIAHSLIGSPLDLPRWRWTTQEWPDLWEEVRRHPLQTGFSRLVLWSLYALRSQWRDERKLILSAALNGGIHHFLICLMHWWVRLRRRLRR